MLFGKNSVLSEALSMFDIVKKHNRPNVYWKNTSRERQNVTDRIKDVVEMF